ncbi:MAG: hypothetical protein Kow0047_01140 [Anaerolineae bacterium]
MERERPVGIIDALSDGFRLVGQHPWLAAIPVALDLVLWLGPRLSIRPLIQRWLGPWLNAATGADGELGAMSQLFADLAGGSDQQMNLLLLLSNRLVGQPSLASLLPGGGLGGVIEIHSTAAGILSFLALEGLGLLIAAVYLSLIVSLLRRGGLDWRELAQRVPRRWLQLVLYLIALTLVLIAVSVPLSLVVVLAAWIGSSLVSAALSLAMMVVVWIGLWLLLSLFFVPDAIVLDDVHVAAAVWRSVNVVGRNLWSTLGLWLLAELIMVGFSVIWQRLSQWPLGALVSICGNAFLGTGIITASFIFYRDRYRRWQFQRVGGFHRM